ncbi:MAG: alkaline phosphatase [Acidobacteria bacterium]|nr:alkaline phosphatase [Acidobacteriota bacterium]
MRTLLILLALGSSLSAAPKRAKNIILFLADAGGVATVNAASILEYGEAQKLFIQSWPNVALSDTSTASSWVTDSAAGMTAIVTGVKTHNGIVSQGPDAVRGKKDGTRLKTILEYAEERGLSTGVISNVAVADATPAACYSQSNDRRSFGEIFLQVFDPRFGDGVDLVMGAGRKRIYDGVKEKGSNLDSVAASKGRKIYGEVSEVGESDARPIVLTDGDIKVPEAARKAIQTLSRNRKGYFLMIEWDTHTDNPEQGLGNLAKLDKLIREVAGMVNRNETLLVFTADHSFDLRMTGGRRGEPILKDYAEWKKTHKTNEPVKLAAVRVDHSHTGEEVIATGLGPGAEGFRGFIPNTRIFGIMMDALGWKR